MIKPKFMWWSVRIDAFLYYLWKNKTISHAWQLSGEFCNDATIEIE